MYWLIYGLGIRLYFVLIRLIAPFHTKARLFLSGRNQTWPTVSKTVHRIWIHVSSLGEFEQARPVIETLRKKTDLHITLTFFSPSGYEIRKHYESVDEVLYMPMDTRKAAESFFRHFDFDLVIFVKYDFWMNHLRVAIQHNIPVLFISVIFRPGQLYFGWAKAFYLPVFRQITHFFVQNEASKKLLEAHGIHQASVVGDTRIDRVRAIAANAEPIRELDALKKAGKKIFVLGSVWASDLELLSDLYLKYVDTFTFVMAPHDISPENIKGLIKGLEKVQWFSTFDADKACDFLVIDNIGMLASLYAYAEFTYVGGAFRGALHNTVEAAAHGKPVFFGAHPNNRKFQEASGLSEAGAGFECRSFEEMKKSLAKLLQDDTYYLQTCQAARDYVEKSSGATAVIIDYITKQLG